MVLHSKEFLKNRSIEYNRKYRHARNGRGYCPDCGCRKPRAGKQTCEVCHKSDQIRWRNRYQKYKELVFSHYGNKCMCCGETMKEFLTIDHINNDGAEHRRKINMKSGSRIYIWIVKNGFPKDLQILCWNCNCGKRVNKGICPHKNI